MKTPPATTDDQGQFAPAHPHNSPAAGGRLHLLVVRWWAYWQKAQASYKRTERAVCFVGLPSIERGCTGKANLGHDYERQAERLSATHGKQYGVYRCPHCKGTHLTTKLDIAAKYFEPLLYVCKPNASAEPRRP